MLYRPVPPDQPILTTELTWRQSAIDDGWRVTTDAGDGALVWTHPDRDDAYGDTEFVYLGAGCWEDAELITRTVQQRRDAAVAMTAALTELRDLLREEPGQ